MKKTAKKRRILLIAACLAGYLLLLAALVLAERDAESATITSLPLAFWYSLTTLSTVGYGDTYPVTAAGRLIGLCFQLMSLGVLAAVLGLALQLVQGRLLPRLRLGFSRRKTWYLFPDAGQEALLLAKRLKESEKDCQIILPRGAGKQADASLRAVCTDMETEDLIRLHPDPEGVCVFLLRNDGFANEQQAAELSPLGCRICLLSDREPKNIPDRISYFSPVEATGRLYWHGFPVTDKAEKIVLVGSGRYAEALLEQALLLNVVSPDQALSYVLCGDWDEFYREHPVITRILNEKGDRDNHDSLSYAEGPWNQDWQPFTDAGRIIFCDDDEAVNAENAAVLLRYCPLKGKVYARLSRTTDGVVSFGGPEELYTPEIIMKRQLSRMAIRMHENYRAASSVPQPTWDELGGFLRRSNLASADHLLVKARILLGPDASEKDFKKAAEAWEKLSAGGKERCRRIEHERWSRFLQLNNWTYGPVRNNAARVHPLLIPFDELSDENQAKDDYAWQLLSQASED